MDYNLDRNNLGARNLLVVASVRRRSRSLHRRFGSRPNDGVPGSGTIEAIEVTSLLLNSADVRLSRNPGFETGY